MVYVDILLMVVGLFQAVSKALSAQTSGTCPLSPPQIVHDRNLSLKVRRRFTADVVSLSLSLYMSGFRSFFGSAVKETLNVEET